MSKHHSPSRPISLIHFVKTTVYPRDRLSQQELQGFLKNFIKPDFEPRRASALKCKTQNSPGLVKSSKAGSPYKKSHETSSKKENRLFYNKDNPHRIPTGKYVAFQLNRLSSDLKKQPNQLTVTRIPFHPRPSSQAMCTPTEQIVIEPKIQGQTIIAASVNRLSNTIQIINKSCGGKVQNNKQKYYNRSELPQRLEFKPRKHRPQQSNRSHYYWNSSNVLMSTEANFRETKDILKSQGSLALGCDKNDLELTETVKESLKTIEDPFAMTFPNFPESFSRKQPANLYNQSEHLPPAWDQEKRITLNTVNKSSKAAVHSQESSNNALAFKNKSLTRMHTLDSQFQEVNRSILIDQYLQVSMQEPSGYHNSKNKNKQVKPSSRQSPNKKDKNDHNNSKATFIPPLKIQSIKRPTKETEKFGKYNIRTVESFEESQECSQASEVIMKVNLETPQALSYSKEAVDEFFMRAQQPELPKTAQQKRVPKIYFPSKENILSAQDKKLQCFKVREASATPQKRSLSKGKKTYVK